MPGAVFREIKTAFRTSKCKHKVEGKDAPGREEQALEAHKEVEAKPQTCYISAVDRSE
jgi:hypothetical protein